MDLVLSELAVSTPLPIVHLELLVVVGSIRFRAGINRGRSHHHLQIFSGSKLLTGLLPKQTCKRLIFSLNILEVQVSSVSADFE